LDGTPPEDVTPAGLQAHSPVFSPNGQRLAFIGCPASTGGCVLTGQTNLYVADLSGQNLVQVTDDALEEQDPAWSPDGAELAFAVNPGGGSTIYRIRVDGTERQRITVTDVARASAWSPDGSTLVIASTREASRSSEFDYWLVSADGATYTRLTTNGSAWGQASWKPDGSQIATDLGPHLATPGIYIMNRDGSGLRLAREVDAELPDWSRE